MVRIDRTKTMNRQSENDFIKRCNLSRRPNVDSDSADVTSSGRSLKTCGPTTGKARLPTVNRYGQDRPFYHFANAKDA